MNPSKVPAIPLGALDRPRHYHTATSHTSATQEQQRGEGTSDDKQEGVLRSSESIHTLAQSADHLRNPLRPSPIAPIFLKHSLTNGRLYDITWIILVNNSEHRQTIPLCKALVHIKQLANSDTTQLTLKNPNQLCRLFRQIGTTEDIPLMQNPSMMEERYFARLSDDYNAIPSTL